MILLFDIGNTRAKYCTIHDENRSRQKVIMNKQLTSSFLTKNFCDTTKIIVASVGNEDVTNVISSWCKESGVEYKRLVSEGKKNNVTSGYQEPSKLGIDRWLAIIGAAQIHPKKNVLIVDAGTATTVDFLTEEGVHHGGWILAGISTLISSVLNETAFVEAKAKEKECISFGLTTSENVHNAAWASTVGAVNVAISQIQEQGFSHIEIVITGGNAVVLSSLVSHHNRVIEDLVFRGQEAYLD